MGILENAYRDRLQIIAGILSIGWKWSGKTKIMYQAGLSCRLLCRYMSELMGAGFISSENGDIHVLTDKEETFLDRHETYLRNCRHMRERSECVEKEKASLESLSRQENPSGGDPRKSIRKGANKKISGLKTLSRWLCDHLENCSRSAHHIGLTSVSTLTRACKRNSLCLKRGEAVWVFPL